MGLGIETNQTFKYVLVEDRQKLEAEKRSLAFRYLSARDCDQMDDLFEQSRASNDLKILVGKAVEGILIGLAGWDGFSTPYAQGELKTVLSRADIVEVRDNISSEMTTTALDKKKCAWRALATSPNSASQTQKDSA